MQDSPTTPASAPLGHLVVRWVYLRALGAIYAIAFASFLAQADGLVGSGGIAPATEHMAGWRQFADEQGLGMLRFLKQPTLCWFGAGDSALGLLGGAGLLLSFLLIAGVAPMLTLFLLWLLYLSLVSVASPFYDFQWDTLLLQTGFMSILLAPPQWRPGLAREREPSRAAIWSLRWLLFHLMFASGVTKVVSGPTWRDLTALTYHYETQPLPPWTAWFFDGLPGWVQAFSAFFTLGVELAVPFLIFAPRRWRFLGMCALVSLQLLIVLTGNYGFFNLLALVLCVLLLDDGHVPERARRLLLPPGHEPGPRLAWWRRVAIPVGLTFAVLGTSRMLDECAYEDGRRTNRSAFVPEAVRTVRRHVAPLRTANSYGLFRTMTQHRDEIVIEGSADGRSWSAYAFRWKPGDPQRAPAFVTPHMPRLDWQMWFASLSRPDSPRVVWLYRFVQRLLEGRPEVLALLEENPFPDAPPRYVRLARYRYRFTTADERAADGAWWHREFVGPYVEHVFEQRE